MAAVNSWVVVITVANFFAMQLLLRSLELSRLGAALGAFVFAFAMPRGQQLGHLQLFPQFFTPLCFLCVTRLHTLRPWTVWGVVACVVLQVYSAVYLGWFLALALGICGLVTVVMCRASEEFFRKIKLGLRRLWLHAVAALTLAVVALRPLGLHYAQAQSEVGKRTFYQMRGMLPRLTSYVLPSDYTFLYRPLLWLRPRVSMAHEQVMFAGFLVLACTVLMAKSIYRKPRDYSSNWWKYALLSILAITWVATLWVGESLWHLVHGLLPGGGAIRAVSRITLLQLLPMGASVAWVATKLEKRSGLLTAMLFSALVVFENSGVSKQDFSAREQATRINDVKSQLSGKNCTTFFLTGIDESWKTHLDAMWASLETQIPTINGYSGNSPPDWPFEDPFTVQRVALEGWLKRHHMPTDGICILDD